MIRRVGWMSVFGAVAGLALSACGNSGGKPGGTGTAGRLAVQLSKYLGAGTVIATGRNAKELEEVKKLGADIVIPFTLGVPHPSGAKDYENALKHVFASGIDVVCAAMMAPVSSKLLSLSVMAARMMTSCQS